jgi:hypothetical protein
MTRLRRFQTFAPLLPNGKVRPTSTSSPLATAQAAVAEAEAETRRIRRLEAALDAEIEQVAHRVEHCRYAINEALAAVICDSPDFTTCLPSRPMPGRG